MRHNASLQSAAEQSLFVRLSEPWREALGLFVIGAIATFAVTIREWSEMLHQWWNIDTYSHILLVPIIIGWLVALKAGELRKVEPRPWLPGLLVVATGLGLWFIGRTSEINLVAHAGAVGALQGVAITAFGPRVCTLLALPLCFAGFLVPFGDEIIAPLQVVTAKIAILLTHWSGIPAFFDGIYIDTPVGLFVVAEACSGVRFLIAMVTLAVLVAFTRFKKWSYRLAFMAVSIIVPIIANGIRAWGTIYIAQSQGVEFAAGFDHVFYGWFFFAFVVVIVLGIAWRFFEQDPEDYGRTAKEIADLSLLRRFDGASAGPGTVIGGLLVLSLCAGASAMIAAQGVIS